MFGWFRKKPDRPQGEGEVALQPPGEVFPWSKGWVLTAVDEVVLALPKALLIPDRPLGDVVSGPDGMEVRVPPDGEAFILRLLPGMSASVARSCQAYVVADDGRPRRIRASKSNEQQP